MLAARLIHRLLLAVLAALPLVLAPAGAGAEDSKIIRVGTLKLIYGITPYFYEKFAPAGYTIEVVPFESPTDGKNAVLTGTVDTCIHGIAAFMLGAEHMVLAVPRNQCGPRRIWAGTGSTNWPMSKLRRQVRMMCSMSEFDLNCVRTLIFVRPEFTKLLRTKSMIR